MNNKLEILKLTMTYCPVTRLYWTDTTLGRFNYRQALDYAQSLDMRLPTKDEFEMAYKNGLKFDKEWFWSSSVLPDYPAFSFHFNGYLDVGVGFDHQDYQFGVRCVVSQLGI